EAGKHAFATAQRADPALRALEAQCLAPLWQAVAGILGEHRARLVQALVAALQAESGPHAPLHVFGLSHLPPAELAVLRAYARRAPVFLYVPDPCREYWGGLHRAEGGRPAVAAWHAFRDAEQARFDDPDALDWREQGHPLLARWGRLGQHFFATLADGEIREDIRHWQDDGAATPPDRLARLQESIRRLQPALMREDVADPAAADDASLRVHACHTRLRELEVLRDALLDAIEQKGVRPDGIVVMAPDIRAYLPLIPAVFGEPGSAREPWLPYHLADVPVARSHRLFTLFQSLLGLGASRLTAPEVVDLLGVPEVQAALRLDAGDADTLVEWLRESRVAWALDGAHKQALALPPRAEHSFAWALDRLLAGYLLADAVGSADPEAVQLADGTRLLPQAGIDGPSAAALGSLDRLLCELQAWRAVAEVEQSASRWAAWLRERLDALVRIDPDDADARAALSVLHRAIANLAAEPARNDEDPPLRLAVVREVLQGALATAPERQRFLLGGITFCGMVPQRAIPFDVVCVLGLDEGAFPRRVADGGIDLMARLPRIGDRDVAGDDRYLFLETVMSARRRLHLSYIGRGVRDGKPRNPAAPLADLLAELDARCGIAPEDAGAPRPWRVEHPLQPFDARYFDGGHPALFSYSQAFAGMRGAGRAPLPGLRDGDAAAPEPLPDPLPLALLEGYFKDPAKAVLKDQLQLSLAALDDDARLPEDEPLDGIARLHTVARKVFLQQVLPRRCADPGWAWDRQPPAWVALGGLLPPGAAGAQAWEEEAAAVEALWQRVEADFRDRFDTRAVAGAQPLRVEVALWAPGEAAGGGVPARLTGLLRNVFPLAGADDGVQLVFAYPAPGDQKTRLKAAKALSFKERVPAFLHWALLRLQQAEATPAPAPVRLTLLTADACAFADAINAWDARYCAADAATRAALQADLRRRLRGLIALAQRGLAGQARFYPQAGWAAVQAGEDADLDAIAEAVRKLWVKSYGDGTGERDHAPGYARLLEGALVFGDPEADPECAALRALQRDAREVLALITLEADAGGDDEDQAAHVRGEAA
ncbi:MAG: exodeoxyribonuclease V subunit gamma, partial [Thermomonas sp.]